MRDEEPGIEIPEGWKVETYRFSGGYRLIAEFGNEKTGIKVRVRPYRTYSDVPGLPDCHKIVLDHPKNGVREVAAGLELEYVEDAEQAALEAMEQFSG